MKRIFLLFGMILLALALCLPALAGGTADIHALGATIGSNTYGGSWNVVVSSISADTFSVIVKPDTGGSGSLYGSQSIGTPGAVAHHISIIFLTGNNAPINMGILTTIPATVTGAGSGSWNPSLNGLKVEWDAPINNNYTYTSYLNVTDSTFSSIVTFNTGYGQYITGIQTNIQDGSSGGQWNGGGNLAPESPSILLLLLGCIPVGLVTLVGKRRKSFCIPLSTA